LIGLSEKTQIDILGTDICQIFKTNNIEHCAVFSMQKLNEEIISTIRLKTIYQSIAEDEGNFITCFGKECQETNFELLFLINEIIEFLESNKTEIIQQKTNLLINSEAIQDLIWFNSPSIIELNDNQAFYSANKTTKEGYKVNLELKSIPRRFFVERCHELNITRQKENKIYKIGTIYLISDENNKQKGIEALIDMLRGAYYCGSLLFPNKVENIMINNEQES
jgi:hypothetical protein